MNPKSPALEPLVTLETIGSNPSTSGSVAGSDGVAGAGLGFGFGGVANSQTSAQETAQLATDAFALAAKVLANEMLVASSDLRVLEDMNNAARERYAEVVDDTLLGVCASDLSILKGLNDDLDSFSTQVLLLERQIAGIEQVTTELDDYTKRLEDSVRRRIVYPFVTK